MHRQLSRIGLLLLFATATLARAESPCTASFNVDGKTMVLDFTGYDPLSDSSSAQIKKNGQLVSGNATFSVCSTVPAQEKCGAASSSAKLVFESASDPNECIVIEDSLVWTHTLKKNGLVMDTNADFMLNKVFNGGKGQIVSTEHKSSTDYTVRYNFICDATSSKSGATVKLETDNESIFTINITSADSCLKPTTIHAAVEWISSICLLAFGIALCFYGLNFYNNHIFKMIGVLAIGIISYSLVKLSMTGGDFHLGFWKIFSAMFSLIGIIAAIICFAKIIPVLLCIGASALLSNAVVDYLASNAAFFNSEVWIWVFAILFLAILLAIFIKMSDYLMIITMAFIGASLVVDALAFMGVFGRNEEYDQLVKSSTAMIAYILLFAFGIAVQAAQLRMASVEKVGHDDIEMGLDTKKEVY